MRTKEEIERLLEEGRQKPIEDDQYYKGVDVGWKGALEWFLEDEPKKIDHIDVDAIDTYSGLLRAIARRINEIIDKIN